MATPTPTPAAHPFVTASEAYVLLRSQGATVLDARGDDAAPPYLPGAVTIDWTDFRDGWWHNGRLGRDVDHLRQKLERLGVASDRPVVVYGAASDGWGEEGRIWWMLSYLGHPRVYIVDGGLHAWQAAGLPVVAQPSRPAPHGHLAIHLRPALRIDWQTLQRRRTAADTRILDVRSRAEYDGATPYGAKRGGHLPGAVSLPWQELFLPDGRVAPAETIVRKLASLGIHPDDQVITYCTGGVRSAMVQAVLLQAGFSRVANYDGSYWEWAANDALPVDGGHG